MKGVTQGWNAFANFSQWMTYMQVLSRYVLHNRGISVGIKNPAKGTVGISVQLGNRAVILSFLSRDVTFGTTISISSRPRPPLEFIGTISQEMKATLDAVMDSLRSITYLPPTADELGAQLGT